MDLGARREDGAVLMVEGVAVARVALEDTEVVGSLMWGEEIRVLEGKGCIRFITGMADAFAVAVLGEYGALAAIGAAGTISRAGNGSDW